MVSTDESVKELRMMSIFYLANIFFLWVTCKLNQYHSVLMKVGKVICDVLSIRKAEKLKFILFSVGTQHAVVFLPQKHEQKQRALIIIYIIYFSS